MQGKLSLQVSDGGMSSYHIRQDPGSDVEGETGQHTHWGRGTTRTSTSLDELLDLPRSTQAGSVAGKIKRAVIEASGENDQLEVEFATASVWFRGKKVAGGGPAPHSTAVQVGCGWIDESALANMLG